MWPREKGDFGPAGTICEVLSVGRSRRTLGQPTKYVRADIHKIKPLNHFTPVPHPLSHLHFIARGVAVAPPLAADVPIAVPPDKYYDGDGGRRNKTVAVAAAGAGDDNAS